MNHIAKQDFIVRVYLFLNKNLPCIIFILTLNKSLLCIVIENLPCIIYPNYTIHPPRLVLRIAIPRDYLASAKVSSASIPFCDLVFNLKADVKRKQSLS